ncbi:PD-(D/E)XK nuclease family protein [Edaphobacter sp. 4G125]|nr:PD-(D/E)XK nuclease family protein [Edaphobacter sp. 4G125]
MSVRQLPVELPPQVAHALDQGATLVTANQRAAHTIRYRFDLRHRAAGTLTWQPATIFSWETWVSTLWQRLLTTGKTTGLLLNRSQEHSLWRKIIALDHALPDTLRSPDSLAELAAKTWKLLAQYRGLERLRESWNNSEAKAFQRWSAEFGRQCNSQHLVARARLEDWLAKSLDATDLQSSGSIALLGFDEHTPAQQNLLRAITSMGIAIEVIDISAPGESKQLIQADNEISEITLAASWTRDLLNQRRSDAQIAVIVPSLETRRKTIDRIFREVLAPELEDIQAPNHVTPYEFSLGVPLSTTSMVRTALELLRWTIKPLSVEQMSTLLLSPFWSMQESDRNARALFDAFELRKSKLLLPEISMGWMIRAVRKSKYRANLHSLLNSLESLSHREKTFLTESKSYSSWCELIRDLLQEAQWRRIAGEDSVEFQTRQKWESALDELASLDFNAVPVLFEQALHELERITQQTLFAPESRHAPIQVMGPLEASGGSFDAIWFLGAGDLSWPVRDTPNPLLPWPLQQDLGLPGSDLKADDLRAKRTTERIAVSAPIVLFSYALELLEGKQRPSHLLHSMDLNVVSAAQIAALGPESPKIELEPFSDQMPLPTLPDRMIAGGAEVLRLQAACAFRAFAERRLGSAELREIELGMDAAERGSIVHRTLEHFWKQVETQAALKSMTRQERSRALTQSIEYGLNRVNASQDSWEQAYLDLQRARLFSLLNPWLKIELKRNPFTVKFSEESSRDLPIGPLRLNVRMDRVDRTDEGEIILDYKTGMAKSADWLDERPDEPQLPLYAVLQTTAHPEIQLADIAFAQIRAGKDMALDSYTGKTTLEKLTINHARAPLTEQLARWREDLEALAEEFYRGEAHVAPKDYPSTCAYCAQRILCRLNIAAFDEGLDEEEATDLADG